MVVFERMANEDPYGLEELSRTGKSLISEPSTPSYSEEAEEDLEKAKPPHSHPHIKPQMPALQQAEERLRGKILERSKKHTLTPAQRNLQHQIAMEHEVRLQREQLRQAAKRDGL